MARTVLTSMAPGEYDPSCGVQLLKRCTNCHSPHPLARTPPIETGKCPDCGTPSIKPGAPKIIKSSLHGPTIPVMLANGFFWIGRKLRKLAERI